MTPAFTQETVAGLLQTRWMGRQSAWFDVVGSTNDEVRGMAEQGAPEGTMVVSRTQSSGRGRQGRTWMSPLGGLWFSLLLRPTSPPSPLLSMTCAAAVCVAIERVAGRDACIKWPNDIVLRPDLLKAGGLLLEGRSGGGQGPAGNLVVVGIGINACVNVEDLEPSVRDIATTVSQDDIRSTLLVAVLSELENRYERLCNGAAPALLEEARSLCVTLNRNVFVEWESGQARGRAMDLDAQGGLVVKDAKGGQQTIWSCLHCSLERD